MRLYFLRHAHAVPGLDDASRPLSDKGEEQCRQLGRFCRGCDILFDHAFSSPLLRARDTAERVLQVTNEACPIELQVVNALTNEALPGEFQQWLADLPEEGHVLLVGHMPSLAAHARYVLGMERNESLSLPKAGLLCVAMRNEQEGGLKFMVSPKYL